MNYKKFDINLHTRYDELARETIKNKINCTDNPDKYGYDLIIEHDYFKGIEVEIINVWKDGNKPPFKDTDRGNTRLFERKLNRYDKSIIFIQLSCNLEKCCIFTKTMVNKEEWFITKSFDRSFIVKNPMILPTHMLDNHIIDFFRYVH